MASTIKDIYRGDEKLYRINLPDFDLSADTFLLAVKLNAADADADAIYQIEKAPPHNITHDTNKIDAPTLGVIYIPVPYTNNNNLIPGKKYWMGVQWVRLGTKPKTLLVQQFKCLQDININLTVIP